MKKVEFAKNSTDIRIVYNNNRAVANIIKMDNGYRVIKFYEGIVWDCDSYKEAREEALNAAVQLERINYKKALEKAREVHQTVVQEIDEIEQHVENTHVEDVAEQVA